MKHLLTILLLLLSPTAVLGADLDGRWSGAIKLPNGELAITVTLKTAVDQSWSGTIDIPAQNLQGFALSNVVVEGRRVRFEMDGVPGQPTFEGELSASGEAVNGTFRQGPQSLGFSLARLGAEEAPEASPTTEGVPGVGAAGEWAGALAVGPTSLRLALHVESDVDGRLHATLDSLDQGATIPIDTVSLKAGTLRLAIARIGGSYEGTLNGDGSAIDGTWSQGGQDLALTFYRRAEPFALRRPQNPQVPFPYQSSEVTFRNEPAGIGLAGTLVIPEGEGKFPAVVFVTGSGPQDRDEALMGHKPFLVIADHLARRGIASLRYDDRGAGQSEGDHLGSTVGDFAADLGAGLAFLATQPSIDREAIGILGHSEGGLTGPRVAAANREVDFLVLLAPPGEPLRSLIARQAGDILRLSGVADALIDKALAAQTEDLRLIGDETLETEELKKMLRARAAAQQESLTEAELAQLQVNEAAIEQGISQATTPWFRSLIREDPMVYLGALKVPVLALFGEKDIQVAAEVNAGLVKAALEGAGNTDYEVRILPGLNHLFQHADTGAVAEYGTIEETFAPEALELVSSWIAKRFSKR